MHCNKQGCEGEVKDGVCGSCGTKIPADPAPDEDKSTASKKETSGKDKPAEQANQGSTLQQVNGQAGPESQTPANQTAPLFMGRRAEDRLPVGAGASGAADPRSPEIKLKKLSARLKAVADTEMAKPELLKAAQSLKTMVPDRFEAWRAQADLWLTAIHELQTRQISPDDNVSLLGVPLRERELRDAAEEALRQCAHHAPTVEQRVALIDEANSIRNMSWF